MAKNALIAVRVSDQMHDALQKLAEDDRRSISTYVRLLIEQHLKTHRPKHRIQAQPYPYAKG